MEDETTIVRKADRTGESRVLGVSVRGWLACAAILTVCLSHLMHAVSTAYLCMTVNSMDPWATYEVGEPMYSLAVAIVGFYFGQSTKQPKQ